MSTGTFMGDAGNGIVVNYGTKQRKAERLHTLAVGRYHLRRERDRILAAIRLKELQIKALKWDIHVAKKGGK